MNRDSHRKLCLGVMAKYWESGTVKTRLGRSIGMDPAAQLHRVFCQFLAQRLVDAADQRWFVVTPQRHRADFEEMLPPAWGVDLQVEGTLGRRMQHWFFEGFRDAPEFGRVLIGADCPFVDAQLIRRTQQLLQTNDVVLGPAVDGGYYLIALQARGCDRFKSLFDEMPWGGDQVFEVTCRRAQQLDLSVATLDPLEDIDTVNELQRCRDLIRDRFAGEQDFQRLGRSISRILAEEALR